MKVGYIPCAFIPCVRVRDKKAQMGVVFFYN